MPFELDRGPSHKDDQGSMASKRLKTPVIKHQTSGSQQKDFVDSTS